MTFRGGENQYAPPVTAIRPERSDAELFEATARRLLEAHGYRAVAMARLYAHGLTCTPGLRWQRFVAGAAREAVEHYAAIAQCYEVLAGATIEPVVEARLAQDRPTLADSRGELAVAVMMQGRAWATTLREHEDCAYIPYREVVARIAKDAGVRQVLGDRFLSEIVRLDGSAAVQPFVDRWYALAATSFGRPGTPGAAYSLGVGLRRRDVALVLREWSDDVARMLVHCGLEAVAAPTDTNDAEAEAPRDREAQ